MVRLDHLTLAVRDYLVARDWYMDVLGLAKEFEIPKRLVTALQDSGGLTLFLEQTTGAIPSASCVLTFQVDSVDETYERLTRRGLSFTIAPSKQFWGYGAELTDPDGYRVRLWDAASMRMKS